MAINITGKYQLTFSDKFEEYMKIVGVGMFLRKMGNHLVPVTEIKMSGPSSFHMRTTTTFKTTDLNFTLGESFKEETADGRTCQSKVTMDGANKMKHEQNCGGLELVMWREFTKNQMKMTLEAPGVTATRIYTKLE